MRLRKLLIAGSALAAAAALTLIPAAQAASPTGGPIRAIHVGATTSGTIAKTMVMNTASITLPIFGVSSDLLCSGSANGTIYPATGLPVTPPVGGHLFERFTALSLTCSTILWGSPTVISAPASGCVNVALADSNVHDGVGSNTDTGPRTGKFSVVDGWFNVTGTCVLTMISGSCTIMLGGSTEAQFDEAPKGSSPPYVQDLILRGNGLQVLSRTLGCFGAVAVGDRITMNNVVFNETNTVGYVDIRQTP